MSGETPSVLEALQAWLFGDNDLIDRMEQFSNDRCDDFEYIADTSSFEKAENKLSYTPIYTDYQALFEKEIGTFLEEQKVSLEDFVAACEAEAAKGGDGDVGVHQWLIAMTEFNEFKTLMLSAKKKKMEA